MNLNNDTHKTQEIKLNSVQLEAVRQIEGPVIIIAGPGSGKTRVITERIAHLLNIGILGQNILALTFTNKAANEMKNRVHKITQNHDTFSIWMGTFHSVFAKILRKEAHLIGYTDSFTIYDNEDSIKTIRRIIKDRNLDKEIYNPKYIFSKISIMKNQLIDSKTYLKQEELIKQDEINKRKDFKNIYHQYTTICHQSNCMDFDDLLINTYHLFKNNSTTLKQYQSIFNYILIDEYQDTNKVQDAIVKQLSNQHKNICIVGDDSQSIYSFRGANINNMLQFKLFYNNVKEFKLEQNYRSTKNIVNAANALISNNQKKIEKKIFTNKEEGDKLKLIEYYNDRDEGDKTSALIARYIHENNTRKSDHAILYRTNSQSKVIEDGLRKRGINYKIFGGLSFYQRKEIKDVMAFLKLILNHHDEAALLRIINYPTRGIGNTTIEKIRKKAEEEKTSIWNILNSEKLNEVNINSSTRNKLIAFKEILAELFKKINENIFYTAELLVEKTGIIKRLEEDPTVENINRLENIGELFNSIKIFSMRKNNNSLLDFINEVSLDESKNKENEKNIDYVSLMTIHQSKGLEFKYVYILGLENGLFPSQKSMKTQRDTEEERRLLYVAITRAIKKVTISYALNRFQFGTIINSSKSFFIDEIDHYLEKDKANRFQKINKPKKNHQQRFKPPKFSTKNLKKIRQDIYKDYRNLKVGQKIKHNIFGDGEIKMIDNNDGNEKITVSFLKNGTKVLLTKFAKFKII